MRPAEAQLVVGRLDVDDHALLKGRVIGRRDERIIVADAADGVARVVSIQVLMVKLMAYAFCTGKPSSRRIEKATYEEVSFRVSAANKHPDHARQHRGHPPQYVAGSRGRSPRCSPSASGPASSAWGTSPWTAPTPVLVGRVALRVRDLLLEIAMEHKLTIASGKVVTGHAKIPTCGHPKFPARHPPEKEERRWRRE